MPFKETAPLYRVHRGRWGHSGGRLPALGDPPVPPPGIAPLTFVRALLTAVAAAGPWGLSWRRDERGPSWGHHTAPPQPPGPSQDAPTARGRVSSGAERCPRSRAGRRVWSEFPRYNAAWGEPGAGQACVVSRSGPWRGGPWAGGTRALGTGQEADSRVPPAIPRAPGTGVHIGGRRAVLVPGPLGERPSREGAGSHPF